MISTNVEAIARLFGVEERPNLAPRYNVAPTQQVPIVRLRRGGAGRELAIVRWGLIPHWAKEARVGHRLINARANGLSTNGSFRESFAKRRCLVVADGFYEWQKRPGGKQPYMVRLRSGEPFGFAGLWSFWRSPEGDSVQSCTIVTTDANDVVAPIHNRMPVILSPECFDVWLGGGKAEALDLLRPYDPDAMEALPVSTRVNNVRNDDPEVIAPPATG